MKKIYTIVLSLAFSNVVWAQSEVNYKPSFNLGFSYNKIGLGLNAGLAIQTPKKYAHEFNYLANRERKSDMGQSEKIKLTSYVFSRMHLKKSMVFQYGIGMGVLHLSELNKNVITDSEARGGLGFFGGGRIVYKYQEVESYYLAVPVSMKLGYVSGFGFSGGFDLDFILYSKGIIPNVGMYIDIDLLKN